MYTGIPLVSSFCMLTCSRCCPRVCKGLCARMHHFSCERVKRRPKLYNIYRASVQPCARPLYGKLQPLACPLHLSEIVEALCMVRNPLTISYAVATVPGDPTPPSLHIPAFQDVASRAPQSLRGSCHSKVMGGCIIFEVSPNLRNLNFWVGSRKSQSLGTGVVSCASLFLFLCNRCFGL